MTVNKFGIHIHKKTDDDLHYFCILPMIGDLQTKYIALPNGEERLYLLTNGEEKFKFPLNEAEVKSLNIHPSIEIMINNAIFNEKSLIGQKLAHGDEIVLLRSYESLLPPRVFITLILKCKIQTENEQSKGRSCK